MAGINIDIRQKLIINAYNRISKAEPTKDKVPMTCGKYVIKLECVEEYNLLEPFIHCFVTSKYECDLFSGAVTDVVCDCTHILMGEKNYLAFRDEYTFKSGMLRLGKMICDYYMLDQMFNDQMFSIEADDIK